LTRRVVGLLAPPATRNQGFVVDSVNVSALL
jgi:hypothetical protein